jgi:ribosomal protein S18 acetylase RimI-like enzyme
VKTDEYDNHWLMPSDIMYQISDLLSMCFDNIYMGRIFFKQMPSCHLVSKIDAKVIGYVGLQYGVIRVLDQLIPIVGIVDLCVTPEHRGDGVATALLNHAQAHS